MSADTAKPLVDGFEKKYPFLKVNFTCVAARK
jgi:hypothetical protein